MPTRLLSLAFVLILLATLSPRAVAQHSLEHFTLDNGLRATLWPTTGGSVACVLVLHDIGERHDPPGRSGLAHLLEHVLVTAATSERGATTAEALAARYNNQFNAQTGEDSTLIAGVVNAAELDEELRLAASRMRSLRVTREDLERELPRVEAEVGNMWGGIPFLGLMNRVKHAALPLQVGARKGGVIEQLRDVTPEELQQRHDALYLAANTRLVVVGAFDGQAVRARIKELFADIPSGLAPGPPAARAEPIREVVRMSGQRDSLAPSVCFAFPMPSPTDDHYPAALVIAARLLERFRHEMRDGRWTPPPAQWAPLDQPEVMFLFVPMGAGEEPNPSIARLDSIVRTIATRPMSRADATRAMNNFGLMLRATPISQAMAAGNPYFAAITIGRAEQLGTPGPALAQRVSLVDDDALAACYEAVFAPGVRGAGVWTVAPPP